MSMPLVFDLTFTMEGGEGERALLQHRQLHRIFVPILCTAIYLLYYARPSMPLYVIARLLSGRCISTVRSYP